MKSCWFITCVVLLSLVALRSPAVAAPAPAAPSTTESDPASDRLTFLTLQLSSAEESIKAVDAAIKTSGYKATVAHDKAANYEKGNELMDRKGGAPVPWDEFYGKTARAFLAPAPHGVRKVVAKGFNPWNDPLKRPKQFDYLYRANNEQAAKAKEDVAAMGMQIDRLLARRRQLEAEQASLWTTIALESIGARDIAFNPLYRFQLTTDKGSPTTAPTSTNPGPEVLRPAVRLLCTADRCASKDAELAQSDLPRALENLKDQMATAENALQESLFGVMQAPALSVDQLQQVKQELALGKRMKSLSNNACDAYRLSQESDLAGDEPRKQTIRGLLQESLLGFSDAVTELDELLQKSADAWGVHGDSAVINPDGAGTVTGGPEVRPSETVAPQSAVDPAPAAPIANSTPTVVPAPVTTPPSASPAAAFPGASTALQPGLLGEYFSGMHREKLIVTRVDPTVDFTWSKGQPPAEGCSTPKYSVRWTGVVQAPPAGLTGIGIDADDGAKLIVDGKVLADFTHPQAKFIHTHIDPGPHGLEVQYHNKLARGKCLLNWIVMDHPSDEQPIPASALFHEVRPR